MTMFLNHLIKQFGLDEMSVEYILLGLLADIRQKKVVMLINKEDKDAVQQGDVQ